MDAVIVVQCWGDRRAGAVIVVGRRGNQGNTDMSGEILRSGNLGKYIVC